MNQPKHCKGCIISHRAGHPKGAVARVNNRGPYVGGRIVNLGHGITSYLGVTSSGIANVRLEVLQ